MAGRVKITLESWNFDMEHEMLWKRFHGPRNKYQYLKRLRDEWSKFWYPER